MITFIIAEKGSENKTDGEIYAAVFCTMREYRFDQDSLLLGAYCFRVDEHFEQTREWFKEAGLQFPVAVSGDQLTEEDLDWFLDNGLGVIAPRSDYYKNMQYDAIRYRMHLSDYIGTFDSDIISVDIYPLYIRS